MSKNSIIEILRFEALHSYLHHTRSGGIFWVDISVEYKNLNNELLFDFQRVKMPLLLTERKQFPTIFELIALNISKHDVILWAKDVLRKFHRAKRWRSVIILTTG